MKPSSGSPTSPQPSRLDALIQDLATACRSRGSKAALARYLGVRPHQVSEWLNPGKPGPNAEHALGIVEWLQQSRPS